MGYVYPKGWCSWEKNRNSVSFLKSQFTHGKIATFFLSHVDGGFYSDNFYFGHETT